MIRPYIYVHTYMHLCVYLDMYIKRGSSSTHLVHNYHSDELTHLYICIYIYVHSRNEVTLHTFVCIYVYHICASCMCINDMMQLQHILGPRLPQHWDEILVFLCVFHICEMRRPYTHVCIYMHIYIYICISTRRHRTFNPWLLQRWANIPVYVHMHIYLCRCIYI